MEPAEKERQRQREDMMLKAPLPRVITKMALPSIISFLITSIYNLADTYFVSDLGESAQAAISVNASLDQIIMMAGSMLAVGAASYISRLLGAKDKEKADRGTVHRLLHGGDFRRGGHHLRRLFHAPHGAPAGRHRYL